MTLSLDLRYAFRSLVRRPVYTAAFVLTLGLGIGANTAIFSVVHGVLLKPLPYVNGQDLVYLRHAASLGQIDNALFSVPEIEDYRQGARGLSGIAEFSALTFTALGLDEPRRVRAGIITGNYFQVMGLNARIGRMISPGDDGEAAPPVAVLRFEFWQRLFGGDPAVIGRVIRMNGRNIEIVGVADPAPPYPERTDLFVNMTSSPHHLDAVMTHDRVHRMTEVFARLAPGATVDGVRAEVDETTARLQREYPEAYDASQGYTVTVSPLAEQLAGNVRPTVLVLLAVTAFVLLIACANVANLTLARVLRRQEELALRVSLGAGNSALRRQLLIENLIPSIAGALVGLLVASLTVQWLATYLGRFSTLVSAVQVDARLLLVTTVLAIGAACVFALIPRLPVEAGHARGSTAATTRGSRRLQRMLVVSQIGLCFVLLVGAGLLLRTFDNLRGSESGVATDEVVALELPQTPGSRNVAQQRRYTAAIIEEVSALPGVRRAALGSLLPLRGAPTGLAAFLAAMQFGIEGQTVAAGAPAPRADFRTVTPDYFDTLGISLVAGRLFDITDQPDSAKAVVINQAMAQRFFPNQDPIGRRLAWNDDVIRILRISGDWRTVVGVVSDARDYGVKEAVPHVVYHPYEQEPTASTLFVRTGQPQLAIDAVTRIVRRLDPDQPIENVATLAQVRADAIAPERLNAILVGVFAALALVIAAVGVAGVLAFNVGQRTHEFGIRAALGADPGSLIRLVVREGALMASVGLVLGVIASLWLAGLLSSLLFGVVPHDLTTFLAVGGLILVVVLLSSALPAWRAARVDPPGSVAGRLIRSSIFNCRLLD